MSFISDNFKESAAVRCCPWDPYFLDVCGKTGTAQNSKGEDHSTFISFAPRNNPKIAIAVYVEHGGFGAEMAVPIASLIEEKYLTDTIKRPHLVEYVKGRKIAYPMYRKKK